MLTGETGAGKTLLTKALGLLMGERAEEGLVGQRGRGPIQAVFDLRPRPAGDSPRPIGELVGLEPGELIVTRRLGKQGRNRCYVNDTAVTLTSMASVWAALLSFAGQHEYRRLLDPAYQLAVLDEWAGAEALELAAADTARPMHGPGERAASGGEPAASRERLRDIELLRFQTAELAAAELSSRTRAALQAEQRVLSRAEDILQATWAQAAELLKSDESDADAADLIGQAVRARGGLAGVDADVDGLGTGSHGGPLRDHRALPGASRHYVDRVNVDPGRLQDVDERLRLYTDLARKYGGSTEAAVAYLERPPHGWRCWSRGRRIFARLEEQAAKQVALGAGARGRAHRGAPRRPRRPWNRRWRLNSPAWAWPRPS